MVYWESVVEKSSCVFVIDETLSLTNHKKSLPSKQKPKELAIAVIREQQWRKSCIKGNE